VKKAELIEGIVHMPPAVRAENHGGPHADLIGCLVLYRASTPGVKVYDNSSIRLDLENEPQPDVAMMIESAYCGTAKLSDDDYIEGAPELVAEVSASTAETDLTRKFRVYARNGVREYLVLRIIDREIDQFVLRENQYERIPNAPDGILRSNEFPGLWIDKAALIRGDVATVLRLLQEGMLSSEHQNFVAELHARLP
jgi:Uma2 family endonuclease